MQFFKHSVLFLIFFVVGFLGIYFFLKDIPKTRLPAIREIFESSKFSLLEAPSESLKAEIGSLEGEVMWKNRIAETPTKISTLSKVQQGESLITGDDGWVSLNFLDTALIKLEPQSEVDIVQTLPNNLVFRQISGTVDYQKTSSIPVSVRVSPLLIDVLSTTEVSIDSDNGRITISGVAKVAYNNKANVTQLVEVVQDEPFIFDPNTLREVQE